jgi:hypothetical protein
MKGGDVKLAIVPPSLGYGARGVTFKSGVSIPPNETLFYEVGLREASRAAAVAVALRRVPPPRLPGPAVSAVATGTTAEGRRGAARRNVRERQGLDAAPATAQINLLRCQTFNLGLACCTDADFPCIKKEPAPPS